MFCEFNPSTHTHNRNPTCSCGQRRNLALKVPGGCDSPRDQKTAPCLPDSRLGDLLCRLSPCSVWVSLPATLAMPPKLCPVPVGWS